MNQLKIIKPKKKVNAFYIKQKLHYTDRFGMQSEKNSGFYIYELDKKTNRHVRIWVENCKS